MLLRASWTGGGIVSPLYPWRYGPAAIALSSWAQSFYPELANTLRLKTNIDPGFHRTGLLMLEAGDEIGALQWATDNRRRMERVGSRFIYDQESKIGEGFSSGMLDVANVRNPRLGQALVVDLKAR